MLYGGRALTDWVLEGGRPERAPFAYAARLRWHALWFEHNWRTQAERLGTLPLPQDPVFIVGPWRSGTTVLHELLAASTGWPTPQTWQCFNPSTCFLVRGPPREAVTRRPMDVGVISSIGPQEDEIAALLLGEDSVYRGFIDPRRLRACAARLWPAGAELQRAAPSADLSRWETFVRGIAAQLKSGRLLLKSPNHTFRLALLRRRFARAQFVWIGRRSRELVVSNIKMWRTMMERYALWQCPATELEGFTGDMLHACAEVLSQCLEEMSPKQLLWLDFESLQAAPREALSEVLDFLSVERDCERERRLDEAVRSIPVHPGSRLLAASDARSERLDALMARSRQHFGAGAVARCSVNR
jgi:hypothetical protein